MEAFFKKCGGRWRRFRHRLNPAQDPEDYADEVERRADVQELAKAGPLDLFYGDASDFCLPSALPCGGQFPGEQVATQPRHSQRFNGVGFDTPPTNLPAVARAGSLDAAFILDSLAAWAAPRTRPVVLVRGYAKIHHAAAFPARVAGTKPVCFLPADGESPPQQDRHAGA